MNQKKERRTLYRIGCEEKEERKNRKESLSSHVIFSCNIQRERKVFVHLLSYITFSISPDPIQPLACTGFSRMCSNLIKSQRNEKRKILCDLKSHFDSNRRIQEGKREDDHDDHLPPLLLTWEGEDLPWLNFKLNVEFFSCLLLLLLFLSCISCSIHCIIFSATSASFSSFSCLHVTHEKRVELVLFSLSSSLWLSPVLLFTKFSRLVSVSDE